MASSYDISGGDSTVELLSSQETYYAIQIVSTSALDADITVRLRQSSDDTNYEDTDNTGAYTTIASGVSTILLETFDFVLDTLYLEVVVGSATAGVINFYISTKKKVDNGVQVENPSLTETNFDAFGRIRASLIHSQADLKQLHDDLPLFYDQATVGTGSISHSTTNAESTLTTSATGDKAIMQTKQRYNYSSGKSSLIFVTCRNFDTETKIIKRVGYFNTTTTSPYAADKDGLSLENNAGTIRFSITKDGTANNINQEDWDDPMDGTGASGVDLQLGTDDGNLLLWIDYEWLGIGQVRFGFIKDGNFYVAHKEDHVMGDGVYMSTPNHSIRAEIQAFSTGSSGTFRLICATYNVENGADNLGKNGAISDNNTHLDANSTSNWYYAIGLRLQAAKADTRVDLLNATLKVDTNDSYEWRLCFNPTYAGTVTYTDVTDYSVSYGLGATANTVSDFGHIIKAGYGVQLTARDIDLDSAIKLGMNIDGTLDEMVLIVKPHSSNLDMHRAINWKEIS